jgi:hypothetical protein
MSLYYLFFRLSIKVQIHNLIPLNFIHIISFLGLSKGDEKEIMRIRILKNEISDPKNLFHQFIFRKVFID